MNTWLCIYCETTNDEPFDQCVVCNSSRLTLIRENAVPFHYCTLCGNILVSPLNDNFCIHCGNRLYKKHIL